MDWSKIDDVAAALSSGSSNPMISNLGMALMKRKEEAAQRAREEAAIRAKLGMQGLESGAFSPEQAQGMLAGSPLQGTDLSGFDPRAVQQRKMDSLMQELQAMMAPQSAQLGPGEMGPPQQMSYVDMLAQKGLAEKRPELDYKEDIAIRSDARTNAANMAQIGASAAKQKELALFEQGLKADWQAWQYAPPIETTEYLPPDVAGPPRPGKPILSPMDQALEYKLREARGLADIKSKSAQEQALMIMDRAIKIQREEKITIEEAMEKARMQLGASSQPMQTEDHDYLR